MGALTKENPNLIKFISDEFNIKLKMKRFTVIEEEFEFSETQEELNKIKGVFKNKPIFVDGDISKYLLSKGIKNTSMKPSSNKVSSTTNYLVNV